MNTSISTLDFIFRLEPWDACLDLMFIGRVEPFSFVCTRDQLVLIGALRPDDSFDRMQALAKQMAQTLVDAHAFFCSNDANLVEAIAVSWIEHKHTVPMSTNVGYQHPSVNRRALQEGMPAAEPFEEALRLLNFLFIGGTGHPRIGEGGEPYGQSLVLALADYSRARREAGCYSAFHAYRALEDIQYAFPGKDHCERWKPMNAALGTDEDTWRELTKAGQKSRHLDPDAIGYLERPETRVKLLSLARLAIERFIAYLKRT